LFKPSGRFIFCWGKFMCYIVFSVDRGKKMVEIEKSSVVTVRLSKQNLRRVEAVRALENVDRSTLFKEFIEDGLRERVVRLYEKGKLSAGRGAEILGVSLREFLELLERECVAVNWDSEGIKEYLKSKYGE
jgi:predicted HTH domain antitoxin